jgi:hypothetical protein
MTTSGNPQPSAPPAHRTVAAWPGWLQPGPSQPRIWAVEADPSLEQAARALRRWHRDGPLRPQASGFNLAPASANYFAWACPAEKSFLDGRPRAFPPRSAAHTKRRAAGFSG